MKKYFKFVGYVELVLWFIGLIAFIMYMAIGGSSHTIVTNGVKVTVPAFISEGYQWFMVIILFLFYIVIGPAIGLLFIHVANTTSESIDVEPISEEENKYEEALRLFSQAKYEEAKQIFLDLKNYRNAEKFVGYCDSLIKNKINKNNK